LVKPIVTGGGQEFGLRSGTENIPSIAGFAKAAELTEKNRISESKRIGSLRNYFWENLKKIYPKAEINGVIPPTNNWVAKNKRIPKLEAASLFPDRLPNILNVYFPRLPAQELVAKFDLAGIAVSAGSACKARAIEPSYVIEALGYSKERAGNSIRFSFGRPTTKKEIDKALKIIRKLLK
jgi:cysteine desulfurase